MDRPEKTADERALEAMDASQKEILDALTAAPNGARSIAAGLRDVVRAIALRVGEYGPPVLAVRGVMLALDGAVNALTELAGRLDKTSKDATAIMSFHRGYASELRRASAAGGEARLRYATLLHAVVARGSRRPTKHLLEAIETALEEGGDVR